MRFMRDIRWTNSIGTCMAALVLFLVFGAPCAYAANHPEISAEGAVLYEVNTGAYLFEKNADTTYYPASVTKLMTALLTLENCNPDDVVTFSEGATENLESGAVSLSLMAGDQVRVKDCLYGLLLKSANEVANGLSEHVSGSISSFASRMNERARELGCTHTNFANPSGLTDRRHVTTARDMALIANACFSREDFREIEKSTVYHFPATKKRPEGTTIVMGHKMVSPGNSLYYPGIIGGKTGYTSAAGNTLVTCAERNGFRLIAVILKSRATQYADTKALLDYGFSVLEEKNTRNLSFDPGAEIRTDEKRGSISPRPMAEETAALVSAPEAVKEAVGPGNVQEGWRFTDGIWTYGKQNGMRAQNERLTIDGFEYWFDEKGHMATGWKTDDFGNWYYLRPSFGGMRKNCWMEENGKWYYFSEDGKMLKDAMTPDGYYVNGEGIWFE